MVEFLPKLLNGITELLLKLLHNHWDLNIIRSLAFTTYASIQPLAGNNYSPALFRAASPPQTAPDLVVASNPSAASNNGLRH